MKKRVGFGPTQGNRNQRMASVMKRELSVLLMNHFDFVGVHITNVLLTPDCRFARVYVRQGFDVGESKEDTAESPQVQKLVKSLNAELPKFRAHLGKTMNVRYVPELKVDYDHGQENAERVEAILAKIRSGEVVSEENDSSD